MNILYIGETDFTRPSASTTRILNCSKSIQYKEDHNIEFIGYGNIPLLHFNGFHVHNVKRGKTFIQKLFYYICRGRNIIKLIECLEKKDLIIYYGSSSRILYPLLKYSRINKIKLIIDVVEWYDYASLPMGKYGLSAIDVHIAMTKLIPKADGIIVISKFLEKYYKSLNHNILKIPVMVDSCQPIMENKNIGFDHDYLNLIYAGTPGKKDIIIPIIEAVNKLNKEGYKIKFHILGCDSIYIKNQKIELSDNIIFYGKLPQDVVPNYLKEADFSILLRPNNRKSNAGFPTKFVESLNAGLPVIANLTSDLSLYLKEGYNGFILEDYKITTLIEKFKYILSLPKSNFNIMRENAKNTAKEHFDYRNYSYKFSMFIKNISK